jgi:hypothetical protein
VSSGILGVVTVVNYYIDVSDMPNTGFKPVGIGRIMASPNNLKKELNSVAFSPQANYTYRATATCRRS